AMIDARDDHVGQMIEHSRDGQMNAVGGRAVDEVKTVGRLPQRKWPVEGKRIARTAAVTLWRDHRDVTEVVQCIGQGSQAGCKVAVIVTEEDAHRKAVVAKNAARDGGPD